MNMKLNGWGRMFPPVNSATLRRATKYAYDMVLLVVVMGGLAPLWAVVISIIAIAIYCDTGRPLFYTQTRLGYRGREFVIYKFRSMHNGAVTRVGRVLRWTWLDELPQVVNIIKGDMSLVGPRPLLEQDYIDASDVPAYRDRLAAVPGMATLAVVLGDEGSMAPHRRLRCDRLYIRKQSICLDTWILWWYTKHMAGKVVYRVGIKLLPLGSLIYRRVRPLRWIYRPVIVLVRETLRLFL